MLNPEKINNKSLLEAIANNLGRESGEDVKNYFSQISQMSPRQALRRFAEWHLGDGEWADIFIENLETLQKAEIK